jgi:hypothetical protein
MSQRKMGQGKGKRQKARPSPRRIAENQIDFPELRGRVVETVEFYSSDEYHYVSVRFDDQTEFFFDIEIENRLKVQPELVKWKEGNSRVLKRWPVFRTPPK